MKLTYSDWIDYGKSFGVFQDEIEDYTGYFIRAKGQDTDILIGHCNLEGGGCNCCADIDYDDIIDKYRKLISKEE